MKGDPLPLDQPLAYMSEEEGGTLNFPYHQSDGVQDLRAEGLPVGVLLEICVQVWFLWTKF